MSYSHSPSAGPLPVVSWPRISATVNADGTGTLTINGVQRPCAAATLDALRAGMTARCVTMAVALHRPVRLTVTEGEEVWPLAVRPNGVVQALSEAGTIGPDEELAPAEGPCRHCGHPLAVTERTCSLCQTIDPLRVEDAPIEAADVLSASQDVEERSLTYDELPRVRTLPRVLLTFSDQEPVTITASASLGRRPEPVDGRQPIRVVSPRRMLSRTHALVDVDEHGQIIVTDHHSGNGIEAQTAPPFRFEPDVAYVVQPGTTLLLGDVACTLSFKDTHDTPAL
jgi:hypothetical protein